MIRQGMIVLSALVLAGCTTSGERNPPTATRSQQEPTQLAAYAASVQFPSDVTASKDLRVAAVLNNDNGTIKIYNFSNQTLRDVRVWINHSFVFRLNTLVPNSSVIIHRDQLYDATGRTLASVQSTVRSIQLQTPEGLYDVQGPALE